MVVFRKHNVASPEAAYAILFDLGIGCFNSNKKIASEASVVGEGKHFIAILQKDGDLEIYGTKNTNSVKYYHINFPQLKGLEHHVMRTKRWK